MSQETKQNIVEEGIDLIEMTVDLDVIEKYCQEQRLKNKCTTRVHYAAHLLSKQHRRQVQLQQRSSLKRRLKKKHKTRRMRALQCTIMAKCMLFPITHPQGSTSDSDSWIRIRVGSTIQSRRSIGICVSACRK